MTHYDESKASDNAGSIRSGKERRKQQRRSGEDRRDMIRFEPDKDDRRQIEDRRKDHHSVWDAGTNP